jgi:hypothetical protein
MDLTGGDAEVRTLLDEEFLQAAVQRFEHMYKDLQATFIRHDI